MALSQPDSSISDLKMMVSETAPGEQVGDVGRFTIASDSPYPL
jgi:hypothetical protein